MRAVWCVSVGVLCVGVCVVCGVCAESVCGMRMLCFGVRGVCGVVCVAVVCVARLGTRKIPVCGFKTPPCVGSRRSHVEHLRAI